MIFFSYGKARQNYFSGIILELFWINSKIEGRSAFHMWADGSDTRKADFRKRGTGSRGYQMILLFFFLGFFLFLNSESLAQTYKYVDKKGTVCFTDSPPPSLFKDEVSKEGPKAKEVVLQKSRSRAEIKDIFQLGQEILEKELAKPPEKQDRRLIQELGENLYGDISGQKVKQEKASSRR
jgi:hypothetical protein